MAVERAVSREQRGTRPMCEEADRTWLGSTVQLRPPMPVHPAEISANLRQRCLTQDAYSHPFLTSLPEGVCTDTSEKVTKQSLSLAFPGAANRLLAPSLSVHLRDPLITSDHDSVPHQCHKYVTQQATAKQ